MKAKEEIVIMNQALGYKIRYQLDSFVNDYNTHISSYTGYPLFENLTGTAGAAANLVEEQVSDLYRIPFAFYAKLVRQYIER